MSKGLIALLVVAAAVWFFMTYPRYIKAKKEWANRRQRWERVIAHRYGSYTSREVRQLDPAPSWFWYMLWMDDSTQHALAAQAIREAELGIARAVRDDTAAGREEADQAQGGGHGQPPAAYVEAFGEGVAARIEAERHPSPAPAPVEDTPSRGGGGWFSGVDDRLGGDSGRSGGGDRGGDTGRPGGDSDRGGWGGNFGGGDTTTSSPSSFSGD